MHLQRNRFVLRGRSRVQHLHTLDLKETCFLQRTVSWDSWLQYSLEQHAACQTSSISNNRLVAVVQVIQNASTPFEEAKHAMSVSGLCGCSFVTIIARTAIRRHRDIGGLESNRDSASAYIIDLFRLSRTKCAVCPGSFVTAYSTTYADEARHLAPRLPHCPPSVVAHVPACPVPSQQWWFDAPDSITEQTNGRTGAVARIYCRSLQELFAIDPGSRY